MLFTILYTVMSVNRFDTKLWLLLNSLLVCFVQLKEKNVQIAKGPRTVLMKDCP